MQRELRRGRLLSLCSAALIFRPGRAKVRSSLGRHCIILLCRLFRERWSLKTHELGCAGFRLGGLKREPRGADGLDATGTARFAHRPENEGKTAATILIWAHRLACREALICDRLPVRRGRPPSSGPLARQPRPACPRGP